MTAQEMYQRRLAALRNPQQRGDASGLINMLAGGSPVDTTGPTSVPLDAEQGPAMGGGLLNKAGETGSRAPMGGGGITAPGKTHFFIKGRGPTIDFGPIFKPRSTGVNPMTGDPFEATSGVGGFFRRLLGDNSDELNSEWQKMRMERQMGLADKAEERLARAEELAATQGFTQAENAAQRTFSGSESAADRASKLGITEKELATRERLAKDEWTTRERLSGEAQKHDKNMAELAANENWFRDLAKMGHERNLLDMRNKGDIEEAITRGIFSGSGGGGARVQSEEAGKVYTDKNGKKYSYYTGEDGRLIRYNLDDGQQPAPGGPDDNARNLGRHRFNALDEASKAQELTKPVTALDGLKAVGQNTVSSVGKFFEPIVMPALRDWYANKIKPTGDALIDAAEQRRRERIANFYE
jgi:hypothetical protein